MPRHFDNIFQRVSTADPRESFKGSLIPPRAQDDRGLISSTGAAFVELARKYVERTELQADPVPFHQYWPTYGDMDGRQQQWYFHWRTQLRHGNWLPAELSYLFLHIYEVINMIGFENPRDAFTHLVQFWRYYRSPQPKLDRYLLDWIADFIVVHKLDLDALNWYITAADITGRRDQDLEIDAWVNAGGDFETLPIFTVFQLASYHPWDNVRYRRYSHVAELDQAFLSGLLAVDAATRAESGKSLFESFRSEQFRIVERPPFERAVHAYPRSKIKIYSIPSWITNRPLSTMLKSLLKYTEAVLLQQSGHKSEQRSIRLKAQWKDAIESALTRDAPKWKAAIDAVKQSADATKSGSTSGAKELNFATRKAVFQSALIPQAPKQKMSIDMSQVEQLSKEAEVLRARLLADDDTDLDRHTPQEPSADQEDQAYGSGPLDGTLILHTPKSSAGLIDNSLESSFPYSRDDTTEDWSADMVAIARVIGGGESKAPKIIMMLMNNQWECPTHAIRSAFPGEFIGVIIDEINSSALEEIGDSLILEEDGLLLVTEDYRGEIEYVLHNLEHDS